MDQKIDPVTQTKEYVEMLLGLLGHRDPAAVQEELADQVEAVVQRAGDAVRTRPAPGEWSVLECLGHLTDSEIVCAGRYRWVLAEDEPPLPAYDQDRWVQRLGHNGADPNELLWQLRTLRTTHLEMWYRTNPEERARVGIHAERGAESYELLFRLSAGHGLFHLEQMRRTLEQVTGPVVLPEAEPAGEEDAAAPAAVGRPAANWVPDRWTPPTPPGGEP